jgi:hypothetical protein
MNRRTTTIVAIGTVAAIAAGSAAVLGVSADATAVPVQDQAVSVDGTQQSFYGTAILLPDNIAAFYLQDDQLVPVGDVKDLSQATLDSIAAQLAAAPAQSVMYVDLNSEDADGLTTAIATVTPTDGMLIGSTNADLQQWLSGLFPTQNGTVASQDIANIPNASYTYTQAEGELTWQITEYVFQYADATVSVHLSTVDETGATQAQFDQMLGTMVR